MRRLALFLLISSLVYTSTFAATTLSNPSLAFTPSVNLTGSTEGQKSKLQGSNVGAISVVNAFISLGSSNPGNQNFYDPAKLNINPNTAIVWTNNDQVLHTVTSGNPYSGPSKHFESPYLEPNQKYNHTFLESGEFQFYCILHPFMRGEVSVTNKPGTQISLLSSANLTLTQGVNISKGSSFPNSGNFYAPSETSIAQNGTVTWTNYDDVIHSVISGNPRYGKTGEFDSGIIQSGQSFNHTFARLGIYDYYSDLHPYMIGKIIVGFNLYKLQVGNRSFDLPFMVTGLGDKLEKINLQSNNAVLEIRMNSQSPGNLTIVIPKDLLSIMGQTGNNEEIKIVGNRPLTFHEISTTPYSRTFAIDFGPGENQIRIAHPTMLNQIIKSDVPLPNPNNDDIAKASVKLTIPRGASEQGGIPFEPQILRLSVGSRITVMNLDLLPHSVTSGTGPQDINSGKFFDSLIIQAGKSSEINTLKLSPGQYDFFCVIHPFMKGKIQVLDKSPMLKDQPSKVVNTTISNEIALSKSNNVTSLPKSNTPLVLPNGKLAPNLPIDGDNNPSTRALSEAKASIVKIVKGSSDPAIGQFFSPTPITVSSGSTISWTNDDDTLHTVTSGLPGESSGKDFDSGYLAAGDTFQHTFNIAGNFDYWCTLHPHMTGKVIVR